MKHRVVIAEDEVPARTHLQGLVSSLDGFQVVGVAGNGADTMDLVRREAPDILLLDIEMPEMTGVQVVRELLDASAPAAPPPAVVFVTAWDEHAIQAFRLNALDYVLKPFEDDRVEDALRHAADILRRRELQLLLDRLAAFSSNPVDRTPPTAPAGTVPSDAQPPLQRLAVRSVGRLRFIAVEDIESIQGAGVYVDIHVDGDVVAHRDTLARLAERLPADHFVRVHRSAIVNMAHVLRVERGRGGTCAVHMTSGARIPVSRTYRRALRTGPA